MEENKNILDRHTVEVEPGIKKLDLVNLLLELDARVKNAILITNELKEVLAGQAAWSKEIDERLQRIDPKIILSTDKSFQDTLDKLK